MDLRNALRCGRHVVPSARDHLMGDLIRERWRITFPNGYEASIFRGLASFGNYEVAVLLKDRVVYDTPVMDDVTRCGSPEELAPILDAIEALPRREVTT